ncbi:hypothetical protein [Guptibacillus spartinae]|uniref:hypothetical protein n=1 Tax=Guptibacillus spartinae TaxID=3025679 RepID=UPI00235FDE4B|nr:hypothetical protein [Pseudalkalibacillus spartinae]
MSCCHKSESFSTACNSCFCKTFSGKSNVALGAIQIANQAFTLGLQQPPIPTGTRRISGITLFSIDPTTCCAKIAFQFNEAPFTEFITADCREVYSFSFAPEVFPFNFA